MRSTVSPGRARRAGALHAPGVFTGYRVFTDTPVPTPGMEVWWGWDDGNALVLKLVGRVVEEEVVVVSEMDVLWGRVAATPTVCRSNCPSAAMGDVDDGWTADNGSA